MDPRRLTVASYNLYLGADLTALVGEAGGGSPARRTAQVWAGVEASRPGERMHAAAAVLAGRRPDVVVVQEAAVWRAGTAGCTRVHDLLDGLLTALRRLGTTYRVVAGVDTFGSGPLTGVIAASTGQVVELLDRCVLLVRADAPVTVRDAASAPFAAELSLPVLGRTLPGGRGWCRATLDTPLGPALVVGTHLEAWDAAVRTAQAAELATVLSRSGAPRDAVPLVLGDLNCRPPEDRTDRPPARPGSGSEQASAQSPVDAYRTLLDAGLADAWTLVPPRGAEHGEALPPRPTGFTWGQAPDLRNPVSSLSERIDLALVDPERLAITRAEVLGAMPEDRTVSGMWPSDHGCLMVDLGVP